MTEAAGPYVALWARRAVAAAIILACHAGVIAVLLSSSSGSHVGTGETAVSILVRSMKSENASSEVPQQIAPARPRLVIPTIDAPRNAPAFRLASPVPTPPAQAASAPSISAETRAAGIRAYGSQVWRRIAERKPKGIHLPGTAYVNFALTGEGAIAAIRIARSSGNPELDAMALRTIESAAPFDPPPSGFAPQDLVFEIPFNFR